MIGIATRVIHFICKPYLIHTSVIIIGIEKSLTFQKKISDNMKYQSYDKWGISYNWDRNSCKTFENLEIYILHIPCTTFLM